MTNQTQAIQLDDLRQRCGGRTKTMIRVLESFIAIAEEHSIKLRQLEIQTDQVQVAKTLHAVKGLLREIAAPEGAAFVEQLEAKLKHDPPIQAEELRAAAQWVETARASARSAEQELRKNTAP